MKDKNYVPVPCADCAGTGIYVDDSVCQYCDGQGWYELPEEYKWVVPHPRTDRDRQRMRDSEERDDMNRDIWGIS